MIYLSTPSSSISNLVLYPRSAFGGKMIFVLGSIRFNLESTDSRFLHRKGVFFQIGLKVLGLNQYVCLNSSVCSVVVWRTICISCL